MAGSQVWLAVIVARPSRSLADYWARLCEWPVGPLTQLGPRATCPAADARAAPLSALVAKVRASTVAIGAWLDESLCRAARSLRALASMERVEPEAPPTPQQSAAAAIASSTAAATEVRDQRARAAQKPIERSPTKYTIDYVRGYGACRLIHFFAQYTSFSLNKGESGRRIAMALTPRKLRTHLSLSLSLAISPSLSLYLFL